MRYYETERECIDYFREEYEFLSNFYPAILRYAGARYMNAEAAYQAQKCADPAEKAQFERMSADEAKRRGQKVAKRGDWDEVKLAIMEEIVRAKFTQNAFLAAHLLETGEKVLKEGNYWGDLYWGVDLKTGEGENHLGQILMALRAEFREKGAPQEQTEPDRDLFGPVNGIAVVYGDITESDCECIVNAANSTLLGGGGVDGAIHRAAGKKLLEECRGLNGCAVGEAKITKGYRLKAKYIIHTVGPHYGEENDAEKLYRAYWNSLALAKENGIRSIAFPSISTGKFSYPKKPAAQIAIRAVADWLEANGEYALLVEFTCVDGRMYDYFCEEIKSTYGNH